MVIRQQSLRLLASLGLLCGSPCRAPRVDLSYEERTRFAQTPGGIWRVELQPGGAVRAWSEDEEVSLDEAIAAQLGILFQDLTWRVDEHAYEQRRERWRRGRRTRDDCSVSENHLELSTVRVYSALSGNRALPSMGFLHVGTLYGHPSEPPDDPIIEVAKGLGLQGLCALSDRCGVLGLDSADWGRIVQEPSDVGILRAHLEDGNSCNALLQLLRAGWTASMLLVFTNGLVPPPFLFNPLPAGEPGHYRAPASFYSCSLSFLVQELALLGYHLRHFAGAYSMFLRSDGLLAEAADEFHCFRFSDILLDDAVQVPMAFVREWFFGKLSIEQTVSRLWDNFTAGGVAVRPFTLGL